MSLLVKIGQKLVGHDILLSSSLLTSVTLEDFQGVQGLRVPTKGETSV